MFGGGVGSTTAATGCWLERRTDPGDDSDVGRV